MTGVSHGYSGGAVSWINIAVSGGSVIITRLYVPRITVHAMQHSRVPHRCPKPPFPGHRPQNSEPNVHEIVVALVFQPRALGSVPCGRMRPPRSPVSDRVPLVRLQTDGAAIPGKTHCALPQSANQRIEERRGRASAPQMDDELHADHEPLAVHATHDRQRAAALTRPTAERRARSPLDSSPRAR